MMKFISSCFAAMLFLGLAASSFAQNTVVTKNADGTYTVIEYPVGKEVVVNLAPSTTLVGSKGMAHVIRTASGTKVVFNVTGLPSTGGSYYAYAIDPSGTPTLLGPLTVTDGTGVAEFTTPMNQFMLAVAPSETWASYVPAESLFTAELPSGYTVIPRRTRTAAAIAVGNPAGAPFAYNVPLLNIPAFGEDERKLTLKFPEYDGLEAVIKVDREKGTTKVGLSMENMKRAPETKRFVLWTIGPDGKYTKLGQVINNGRRDDTSISSETGLKDFGLFVTIEDADVTVPTSQVYQVVKIS